MLGSDTSSARKLTLVAMIVQTGFFLFGVALLVYVKTTFKSLPTILEFTLIAFSSEVFVLFVWILLDYFFVYRKLVQAKIAELEKSSMTLGIFQLLIGGVVAGILLLVAHTKIRNSLEKGKLS